ncbi:hypothetical protein BC628DRAFT_1419238 [Trametes gibbosa]|nr:hypothetical protein BC628DRAFT_1419238 [Trametes gibbosa]
MSLATDFRPSPFTVQEFSDLLSSAFNLHDPDIPPPSPLRPALSFTPPSPHPTALARSQDDLPSAPGFESETVDGHHHPRSPSLDALSPQLSPREGRSRSRTITALRVFHQVRTRASAFVLRPRAPSLSPTSSSPLPFEPLPPLSIDPTLISSPPISRSLSPLSMVDLNRDSPSSRPRSRADSLPRARFFKRETTPPPLPGRQTRPNTSAGPTSATPDLRSFFDDSPQKSQRAYSRPSTSASTLHPLSRVASSNSAHAVLSGDGLPSFFEDTGYQVAKPAAPHYSRPTTPASGSGPRIHTRLPPLRKSKSGGQGLFSRGGRRGNSKSDENAPAKPGLGNSAFWDAPVDGRTPSPFTCPRDAPPIPAIVNPLARDSLDDFDAPLPPAYVFERRGSATSTSTASTRSTSSISSKISSIVSIAFPSKMRTNARSKLNLSIATGPDPTSTHSSPSTLSSLPSPTTPVSPTTAFPRSQPYIFPSGLDMHSQDHSFVEAKEDALAIGRVLTPEADPFAKADISIPIEGPPRPPTPPVSRRASSQTSPPIGLYRAPTWDEERVKAIGPMKRTRNSLPASPVSSASTFPSSCSVYQSMSPSAQPPPTPRRVGPPSAWSPFSTPAASSPSARSPSTPTSSPGRSTPSSSKSGRRFSSQSPPSPTMSAFPLPPRTLPPPFPPPSRALPALPTLSPPGPPVPPKDSPLSHVTRAHKSLPPSPRPLESLADSPASVRSYGGTWASRSNDYHSPLLPLGTDIRDLFAHAEACPDDEATLQSGLNLSPPSLGEPWSGGDNGGPWATSEMPPGWRIRPAVRRRSVDSTSTVTASPSSSALHDAARGWASGTSTVVAKPPTLELDTLCVANASSTILHGFESSTDSDSDCCSSAVSLTTFYTAPSSPGPDSPAQTSPTVSFSKGATDF